MHWRRKRGGQGGHVPPPLFCLGGQWYVCAPPHFTPYFHLSLELYVYIKLTNNYLAFFIYQLIILWTISINWHRWLLVNNHIPKYNSFILVLYRRYINYVYVCPPTFWHLPTPLTCDSVDSFLLNVFNVIHGKWRNVYFLSICNLILHL